MRNQQQSEAVPSTAALGTPAATRGLLTGFTDAGEPLVDFPNNPAGAPIPALATVELAASDAGRDVLLVFEDGDAGRPIFLGSLCRPVHGRPRGAWK